MLQISMISLLAKHPNHQPSNNSKVHDEVILEGPEETAEEAFEEVVKCMQEPWVLGLQKTKVPLLVDGSYSHDNWYDAK